MVALTFDLGGTTAGSTAHVLDTLKAYKYRATFFLTGQWTAANPALVKRMAAEGHELANHTYSHPNLTEISPDKIKSEIWTTEAAIVKASGTLPSWLLRPPFGAYDPTVRIVLGELGYDLVFWSVDSGDWQGLTSSQIVKRVDERVGAGDVVVFHAYAENTGQAIGGVCETLRTKHLTGGTLSQALGR